MHGAPEDQLQWAIDPELGCLTIEGYNNIGGGVGSASGQLVYGLCFLAIPMAC